MELGGQVMCKLQSRGLDLGTSDPAALVLHLSMEAQAMSFEGERPRGDPLRDLDSCREGEASGPQALASCGHRSNLRQTMNREK